MNRYWIQTIETTEHNYYIVAETEDEALTLFKTKHYDPDSHFIDEEFKSIEVEAEGVDDE